MTDFDIDDHLGTAPAPRPSFEAELRTRLIDEWEGRVVAVGPLPRRSRATWMVVTGVAATALLVAGLVALARRDPQAAVTPAPPTTSAVVETTAPDSPLRDAIVDHRWVIVEVNGAEPESHYLPFFTLAADGQAFGSDGCNDVGTDLNDSGSWRLEGTRLIPPSNWMQTAVDCGTPYYWPIRDPGELELMDATSLRLTNDAGTFVARAVDSADQVDAADVAGEWRWHGDTFTIGERGEVSGADNGTGSPPEFHLLNGRPLVILGSFLFYLSPLPDGEVTEIIDVRPEALRGPIQPEVISTIPWGSGPGQLDPATASHPLAAATPAGRVLVVERGADSRATGKAVFSDGAEVSIDSLAGSTALWVALQYDLTLFAASTTDGAKGFQVAALNDIDDAFVIAKSSFSDSPLGDAPFELTAQGVLYSGRLVLDYPAVAAPTAAQLTELPTRGIATVSTELPEKRQWKVRTSADVDLFDIETQLFDVGRDVVIAGPADSRGDLQFLAVLSGAADSVAWDLDGWQIVGAATSSLLMIKAMPEGLMVGRYPPVPQIDGAAILGVGPAMPADDVIPAVSTILGQPTFDTGWTLTIVCGAENIDQLPRRIVRWGNLSMEFVRFGDDTSSMLGWSLGDVRAGWLMDGDPPLDPAAAPVQLRTSDGLGIGSSFAEYRATVSTDLMAGEFDLGDATQHSFAGAQVINVVEVDGTITGIGALLPDC